ncbi:hypothetical protein JCM5350_007144 [Sporobolomyces pararoseus]
MSFSSLPPELVHQIIESTVPHTFHSFTYKERRRTLRRLSLVSKLFRSIAQPLLLEIVWVSDKQIDNLPLEATKEGKTVKKGVVCWAVVELAHRDPEEVGQEKIEESLRKISSVSTLTLAGPTAGTIDLAFLRSFSSTQTPSLLISAGTKPPLDNPDLANLQLSGTIWTVTQVAPMPQLHSLTFDDVSEELFVSLLDPTILPNLIAFALLDSGCSLSARTALRRIQPQLRELSFDIGLWNDPEYQFLHSKSDQALVDCHSTDLPQALDSVHRIVHLRVFDSHLANSTSSAGTISAKLQEFAVQIQSRPSLPLRTIYLDVTLSPLSPRLMTLEKSMEELNRVCLDRNIDIVFEQVFHHLAIDPCLSLEFATRQKERVRLQNTGQDLSKV